MCPAYCSNRWRAADEASHGRARPAQLDAADRWFRRARSHRHLVDAFYWNGKRDSDGRSRKRADDGVRTGPYGRVAAGGRGDCGRRLSSCRRSAQGQSVAHLHRRSHWRVRSGGHALSRSALTAHTGGQTGGQTGIEGKEDTADFWASPLLRSSEPPPQSTVTTEDASSRSLPFVFCLFVAMRLFAFFQV